MIIRFEREGKDHREEIVRSYQTGNFRRKKLFNEAKQTPALDHSQHLWRELG